MIGFLGCEPSCGLLQPFYRRSRTGLVSVINCYLCDSPLLTSHEDLQNALFEISLKGKLNLAPIKVVHNCLDVGTGTGIWAIDFGMLYPCDC